MLNAEILAALNAHLDFIDAAAAKTLAKLADDDPRKAILQAAMKDAASVRSQVNPTVETALRSLEETNAALDKKALELIKKQEELKAANAAARKTLPPAPEKPAPTDPALPAKLHDEFIKEYGRHLGQKPRDAASGDVWEPTVWQKKELEEFPLVDSVPPQRRPTARPKSPPSESTEDQSIGKEWE